MNADRLVRLVGAHPSERVRAYWSAIATWLKKDRRLARLGGAYDGAPIELLPTGTEFQVKRRGEDERFTGSKLRVPKGTLRDRHEDVLPPEVLVRRHAGYRNRVLMGPSFRADVWTALRAWARSVHRRHRAEGLVLLRDRVAGRAGLPSPARGRTEYAAGVTRW